MTEDKNINELKLKDEEIISIVTKKLNEMKSEDLHKFIDSKYETEENLRNKTKVVGDICAKTGINLQKVTNFVNSLDSYEVDALRNMFIDLKYLQKDLDRCSGQLSAHQEMVNRKIDRPDSIYGCSKIK